MGNHGLTNEEIEHILHTISDEEESASEIDDYVSENELSSDDDTDEESEKLVNQSTILLRKDDKIEWNSEPQPLCGRRVAENVINMTPGPARYATSKIEDEYSSFIMFFPPVVVNIILKNSNIRR